MTDLSDIARAIEDSNTSFADFKAAISARLDHLETREAKANRRHVGGTLGPRETSPEGKAFDRYVRTGDAAELKSMSSSIGSDGGYSVPKQISDTIESLMLNISPIRQIATVRQISTSDFHQIVNLRGTASGWAAETDPRTATTTPQVADVQPPMGDLWAFPLATQTLLDDSAFDVATWLAQQVADEFARAEGAAFVSGNGVNRPMGFLSGAAPVSPGDDTRAFGTRRSTPS